MCPRLADLGLTTEKVGEDIDYATIPDQFGSFPDPPQPGPYRFKLPQDLSAIWEVFDHTTGTPPGKRISAKFDDAHPLMIVQSPGGAMDNEPFQTKISNAERKRGKKDDATAPNVSDMDYMNRDVWGISKKPAGGNPGYAAEFMKHGGTEFGADIEWSWKCNEKKDIYVDNGQGGLNEVTGQKGCGTAYYQKDIKDNNMMILSNPEDPGSAKVYPLRITCPCGANVRAFANLRNFRA